MNSGVSRFGKPPPGYIAGLGRGAVGIQTRSDIGPARNAPGSEYNIKKEPQGNLKRERDGASSASNTQNESENDMRDYSESNFNQWNGYEENLFSNTEYDEEDRDADSHYNMIDQYMDERRKSRKEKKEYEMLMKFRSEKPTIKQTFSDLKNDLKKLTYDEWEKIPDIGDFTVKKRKIERYTPITDRNIENSLNENKIVNAIDPINLGMETPYKGTESSDILNELGKAKNSVLSVVFDKMSDKVSGMNSVNPIGYLTEMNSVIKINSPNEVQDFKKARIILKSILNTDKNNVAGWIAAARLEELDGKIAQARNIIAQAAQNILDSEDIWFEAARLHPPQEAKIILAKGISHLPNSRKLWLAAFESEQDKSKKALILRKALENLPSEEEIWKKAIELENEDEAKLLLYRAVECIPNNVNMWLALARLETYNKAKAILNKARKALPLEHSIWVHAAKLEEAQNIENIDNKVDELIERGIKTLIKNGKILPKEVWLKEAENCEMAGSVKTCSAIIKAVIKGEAMEANFEDKIPSWVELSDESKNQGCIETSRFIYDNLLTLAPDDIELWVNRIKFEKNYGNERSQESVYQQAVEKCPTNEILWLMYAKHKWQTESVDAAKELLLEAMKTHPLNEQIILAMVKLEKENNNYKEAKRILEDGREKINTPRIWMQLVQILREEKELDEAFTMCDQALKRFPDFVKLWMISAQLKEEMAEQDKEHQKEQLEMAVKIYEKGIENNKKNTILYISLSRLLLDKLHREAVSRRVLEMGLKALPTNEKIWTEIVKFEKKCKNYSNANVILSKGLKELPLSGLLWSLAIEMEKQHNKHSKAADALAKIEYNEHVMTSVAKIFVAEKNMEKARKWFENSIRVNSNLGDTWIYYYKAELEFGDEEKAEDILKRCEQVNPKHGEIWTSVSKKVENWKLKTKDILLKAIKLTNYE